MWNLGIVWTTFAIGVNALSVPTALSLPPSSLPLDPQTYNHTTDLVRNISLSNGSGSGNSNLEVPFAISEDLKDINVDWEPGAPLNLTQYQHVHMYLLLFNTMVGFWRTPTYSAVATRINIAGPPDRSLILTIIPMNEDLTIAVVAAVLYRMCENLTKTSHPTFGTDSLTTKPTPPSPAQLIGLISTGLMSDSRPAPESRFAVVQPSSSVVAVAGEDGIGKTTTVSALPVTIDVQYTGQGGSVPPITPRLWLQFFHEAIKILFYYGARAKVFSNFAPTMTLFEKGTYFPDGSEMVTRFRTCAPSRREQLKFGDLVSAMGDILRKVITDKRFELMEAKILQDGVAMAQFTYTREFRARDPQRHIDVA